MKAIVHAGDAVNVGELGRLLLLALRVDRAFTTVRDSVQTDRSAQIRIATPRIDATGSLSVTTEGHGSRFEYRLRARFVRTGGGYFASERDLRVVPTVATMQALAERLHAELLDLVCFPYESDRHALVERTRTMAKSKIKRLLKAS